MGKLGSNNTGVLDLMRRILAAAARGNFTVTLKHIAGVDNSIADALSRFQEDRFRRLAPLARIQKGEIQPPPPTYSANCAKTSSASFRGFDNC